MAGTAFAAAPELPTNLTATAVAAGQINLSWTASTTIGVNYNVYRSETTPLTPSLDKRVASGLTATTWSDSSTTPARTYYYVVTANNASMEPTESAISNVASATADATAPANSSFTSPTTNVWFSSSTADPYTVVCTNTEVGLKFTIEQAPDNSTWTAICTDDADGSCSWEWDSTGAADKASWYLRCKTKDAAGNVEASYATVTIAGIDANTLEPDFREILHANNTYTKTKQISFKVTDKGSGVKQSSITVKIDGANSAIFNPTSHCTQITNGYSCTYTEESITTEKTYTLEISAQDNLTTPHSKASTTSFIYDITAPAVISSLNAAAGTNTGEIILSWTTPTGSDLNNYDIRYSTTNIASTAEYDAATQVVTEPTPTAGAQSMTLTGLLPCVTYYSAIKTTDKAGNTSAISNIATTAAKGESTAPAIPNNFVVDSYGNGFVKLTWSANTESDFNSYRIFRSTSSNWDSNTLITRITDLGTTSYRDTSVSNGTAYYYKILADDKCGNGVLSGIKGPAAPQAQPTQPTSTPSINSDTHSEDAWSRNNDPRFSWSSEDGATYYYTINHEDNTTPDSGSSNCTCSSKEYNDLENGTWYFHLRARKNEQWSSTDHFKVKIDTSAPTNGTGLKALAQDDGTIDVFWDASSDEHSGIKEYWLYRDDSSGFSVTSATRIYAGTSQTYHDTDVAIGKTYYYKVRAVDNAGNEGSLSDEKYVKAKAPKCNFKAGYGFDKYIGGEEFTLEITSDDDMFDIELSGRVYGVVNGLVRKSIEKEKRKITARYELAKGMDGKQGEFNLNAEDDEGNNCWYKKEFTVDAVAPEVSFSAPADSTEVERITLPLEAKATDGKSGIKAVNFYYKQGSDWISIASDNTAENGKYSVVWDSSGLKAGSYTLKAEAADKAGNSSSAEKTISVTVAKEEEILTLETTETQTVYHTASFAFDEAGLADTLRNAKLEESLVDDAIELMEGEAVKRELVISKNGDNYTAKIVISFTNNWDATIDTKIVEPIPKSFAKSASEIESSFDFEVINEDPLISFSVNGIETKEQVEISYSLKQPLNKEEADELISKNVINEFVSPPIVLDADCDLSKSFGKEEPFFLSTLATLFSPKNLFSMPVIVSIMLAVIVVLATIAAFTFAGYNREGSQAGENSDLYMAINAMDRDIPAKISRKLGGVLTPGKKKKAGRFAYRGK